MIMALIASPLVYAKEPKVSEFTITDAISMDEDEDPCGDTGLCHCTWGCKDIAEIGQCIIDAATKGCNETWEENGQIKKCDDISVVHWNEDETYEPLIPRPIICHPIASE